MCDAIKLLDFHVCLCVCECVFVCLCALIAFRVDGPVYIHVVYIAKLKNINILIIEKKTVNASERKGRIYILYVF